MEETNQARLAYVTNLCMLVALASVFFDAAFIGVFVYGYSAFSHGIGVMLCCISLKVIQGLDIFLEDHGKLRIVLQLIAPLNK